MAGFAGAADGRAAGPGAARLFAAPLMAEPAFTDEQIDRAIEALSDPERFREAEARVARAAPQLQRDPERGAARGRLVRRGPRVAGAQGAGRRGAPMRTLLAEETRMGMLVGVAVGWELRAGSSSDARLAELPRPQETT